MFAFTFPRLEFGGSNVIGSTRLETNIKKFYPIFPNFVRYGNRSYAKFLSANLPKCLRGELYICCQSGIIFVRHQGRLARDRKAPLQ
jgi:hypothetical protein